MRDPIEDNHGDWGRVPSSLGLVVLSVPQPANVSAKGAKLDAFIKACLRQPARLQDQLDVRWGHASILPAGRRRRAAWPGRAALHARPDRDPGPFAARDATGHRTRRRPAAPGPGPARPSRRPGRRHDSRNRAQARLHHRHLLHRQHPARRGRSPRPWSTAASCHRAPRVERQTPARGAAICSTSRRRFRSSPATLMESTKGARPLPSEFWHGSWLLAPCVNESERGSGLLGVSKGAKAYMR